MKQTYSPHTRCQNRNSFLSFPKNWLIIFPTKGDCWEQNPFCLFMYRQKPQMLQRLFTQGQRQDGHQIVLKIIQMWIAWALHSAAPPRLSTSVMYLPFPLLFHLLRKSTVRKRSNIRGRKRPAILQKTGLVFPWLVVFKADVATKPRFPWPSRGKCKSQVRSCHQTGISSK